MSISLRRAGVAVAPPAPEGLLQMEHFSVHRIKIYVIYITMKETVDIKVFQLKKRLDELCNVHRLRAYIKDDPIEFPHLYQDPKDIELAGLIASALAFGRVDLFKPVIKKVLSFSSDSLYDYVINFDPHTAVRYFDALYYRMCKGRDMACLIFILSEILREYGTIGNLFYSCYNEREDIRGSLKRFVEILRKVDTTPVYGEKTCTRGLLQLLPSPEGGGPCKRFNMSFRWMVRADDGIDFGLWDKVPPSSLVIPLDTHIARICKGLNMTKRKTAGWAMAEEITGGFRLLTPEDPLKYDFALCHLGISGKWKEVLIDEAERDTS